MREVTEKAARIGGLYGRALVDGVLVFSTMTTSWTAATKFVGVSKPKAFVALKRRTNARRDIEEDVEN